MIAPFFPNTTMSDRTVVENGNLFTQLMEWIWIPFLGALVWMWAKVTGIDKETDKRLSLLEQHWVGIEAKLAESDARRRQDRQEIMDKIERHHEVIYKKLDLLADKIASLKL